MKNLITNRVFLKWWLTYIMIMLLPFIAGTVFYFQSVDKLSNEIDQSYSLLLDQVKLSIDQKLSGMIYIGQELTSNTNVDNLTKVTESKYKSNEIMSVVALQKELIKISALNGNNCNIFIFFPSSKTIITSTNIYRAGDYDNALSLMGYAGADPERFFNEKAAHFDLNGQNLIFYRRLSMLSFPDTPSAVITLNYSTLEKDLETTSLSSAFGGSLAIESSNGQRLTWGDAKDTGETPIILKSRSDINNWTYIASIPSTSYGREITYLRNVLIVYFGLCLLIGIILAFFITRRNYTPVNKIITMVMNRLDTNSDSDVFGFLESRLRMLLSNYEKSKDDQQDSKRVHALRRLLRSEQADYYEAYLKQSNMDLSTGCFLLLLIRVDEYDPMFEKDTDQVSDILDLLFFVIRNVMGELISEKYASHFAEIDGDLACFVCHPPESGPTTVDNIRTIVSDAKTFIAENFGVVFSVVIGTDESKSVNALYSDALETAEYLTMMGKKGTVTCSGSMEDDEELVRSLDSIEILDLEKKLVNFLTVGDYPHAISVVNTLIEDSASIGSATSVSVRNRMCRITDMIEYAVKETLPESMISIQKLSACKSIESYRAELLKLFRSLEESKSDRQLKSHSKEIERVMRYIDGRYSDPSLSVVTIADELIISTKQLARYLKEGADMGPLDYIQSLRLEKAKALLLSTDLTVLEIAQKIGYINGIALNRLFKKYEGISPSQFRDQ